MNPTNTDPVQDEDSAQPVTKPNLKKMEQGWGAGAGTGSGTGGGGNFNFNPRGDRDSKDSGTGTSTDKDSGFRVSGDVDDGTSGSTGTAGLLAKEMAIGGGMAVSGPFEFVHIAQLLEQDHFSVLQDESNDRLFEEMRYVHYQNKGEAYKTNLGYIGNKLADKFDADLKAQGLESTYTPVFGLKDGYVIDRENEQFKGMNDEEIKSYLDNKYNGGGKLEFSTITDAEGNEQLFMKQPSGYFLSRRITSVTLQDADLGDTTSAIGARIMGTRDGVTWSPLKKLDSQLFKTLEDKYAEWTKERTENESSGIPDDLTAAIDTENNPDATPAEKAAAAAAAAGPAAEGTDIAQQGDNASHEAQSGEATSEGTLSGFTSHVGFKIGAGGAAAAGVLCMARGLAEQAGNIKQAQVELPLVRIGIRALSEGNQVMSGQNVDAQQLSLDSKQLYDATTKTDWSAAQSIQAETGHPGDGVPPGNTLQTIGSGTPLDFLLTGQLNSILSPVCSTAGQVAQNVIGFFGGPIEFLTTSVVSAAVTPTLTHTISQYLAGQAVNYAHAKGAQFGSYIDYGARLGANDQAISEGGRALSSQEEGTLSEATNDAAKTQFDQHNLAYRIFDPNDRMSMLSSLMDNQSGSVTANMSNVALAATSVTHSLATTFSDIFSGIAHADPQPYDYGFPEIAFSQDEMDNSSVANPYANGDAVADILDKNGQDGEPDYISLAQQCFHDTLQQISVPDPSNGGNDQVWDVSFGTDPVNIYSQSYKNVESSCNSTSDPDWLKIRFFIFDTQNIKAADCYDGDDQMCTEMGFSSSDGSTGTDTGTDTSTPGSGTLPTGTSQDLAKQIIPYINSGKIQCSTSGCPDIVHTANGVSIKTGDWCLVDSMQPGILGLILGLVQAGHTFTITAMCSDHPTLDGPTEHNGGRAADFGTIDGVYMGSNPDTVWNSQQTQAAEKFDQDAYNLVGNKNNILFGQVGSAGSYPACHPVFSFQSVPPDFDDGCNHQHIAVESN
jgi:hypothetical protein